MDFLEPWDSLDEEPSAAAAMVRQLANELSPRHPLFGESVRAIGRRCDTDDVLYVLDDGSGRVAEVHLTWRARQSPPSPFTLIFESFEEWVKQSLAADHREFNDWSTE